MSNGQSTWQAPFRLRDLANLSWRTETTKGRKTRNNLESVQPTYFHSSFVFSFFRVFVMEFAFARGGDGDIMQILAST
jgi:hypothetical protein